MRKSPRFPPPGRTEDIEAAFVVKDGNTVELRPIEIRRTQNLEAVIGKGLQPGEQVVIDGQLRLVNGASVAVREPQNEAPKPSAQPRG